MDDMDQRLELQHFGEGGPIAEVDCHARPLAGEATRRVGFFDAPVSR